MHTLTPGRDGEKRRARERYIHALVQLLRGFSCAAGLGWAATPLDHLSNVAFDIAHIRRKIKTLPGKLPDQFKWPFFMARTRRTRSLPSLSLSFALCLSVWARVCVDSFQVWTAACFMRTLKCGRSSELVHGPKNDAVCWQDNARSARLESVPMVAN